jgi:hypothetical protein
MEHNLRSPRVLFKKYLSDFPSIGLRWEDKDKTWTSKNLGYFRKLGKDKGYVCWPDPDKEEGGYLVDLCWEECEENKYRWLELILEEEWGDNDWDGLAWDFGKLVDMKAYIKVFICFPKEAQRREMPLWFADRISEHALKYPDESYLIIVFSRDARREVSERLQIEGFAIDYKGELMNLGSQVFSD